MTPNETLLPDDRFSRTRPYLILALLILLFLLLLLLSLRKNAAENPTPFVPASGGKSAGSTSGGAGSKTGTGSGSGTGSGTGAGAARAAGQSVSPANGDPSARGSRENGESKERNASSRKRKTSASPEAERSPRKETSSSPSAATSSASPAASGTNGPAKEKSGPSSPARPVRQWKSNRKNTLSEKEIWFLATLQIRNLAKDKRDLFEFPDYGVPNTSMRKIADNLYEVQGFFRVKTHTGSEKMYRFSMKVNLADTRCSDLVIEDS